jgi:hypothetical protein
MSDEPDGSTVRSVSKALFGSGWRLQAAAYIANKRNGQVYARELARAIGMADNEASNELRHFRAAQLLAVLPRARGGREPQLFERQQSSFWRLANHLLAEIQKD